MKGPSVSTLLRISQALKVPISNLFQSNDRAEKLFSLVRRHQRKSFERAGSKFGANYETLAHNKAHKGMEPFVMSPPQTAPTEYFQHPGEEMLFVLSGRMRVWLKNKVLDLNKGDCVYFDGTIPHRTQSLSKARCSALLIISAA